jgi:hypothetical protein
VFACAVVRVYRCADPHKREQHEADHRDHEDAAEHRGSEPRKAPATRPTPAPVNTSESRIAAALDFEFSATVIAAAVA